MHATLAHIHLSQARASFAKLASTSNPHRPLNQCAAWWRVRSVGNKSVVLLSVLSHCPADDWALAKSTFVVRKSDPHHDTRTQLTFLSAHHMLYLLPRLYWFIFFQDARMSCQPNVTACEV